MGPTGNSRGSSSKNTSKSSFNSLSIAGALQCTAGVVLVLNCSCGALKEGRSLLLHQNTTATLCHGATPGIVPGPFVVCFKKAKQLFRDLKSIQNLPENAHPSSNGWLLGSIFEYIFSTANKIKDQWSFFVQISKALWSKKMQFSAMLNAEFFNQFCWFRQCSKMEKMCSAMYWYWYECKLVVLMPRPALPPLSCLGGWGHQHWGQGPALALT